MKTTINGNFVPQIEIFGRDNSMGILPLTSLARKNAISFSNYKIKTENRRLLFGVFAFAKKIKAKVFKHSDRQGVLF